MKKTPGSRGSGPGNRHFGIFIGASAGGIEAVSELLGNFPATGRAAIFVTVHVPCNSNSLLPQLLQRASRLPAAAPMHVTKIQADHIYVAPPNHHLVVSEDVVQALHGPKENLQRPAINPMFRSGAQAFGRKAVGVVLSGMLDDGASGLHVIKAAGGVTMVQDPDEAAFPGMPRAAAEMARPDFVLPIEEMRAKLAELATSSRPSELLAAWKAAGHKREPRKATARRAWKTSWERSRPGLGAPSGLVCPECQGPLWQVREGGDYACLIGHSFSPQALLAGQAAELERALWTALRTLDERAELQSRLARRVGLEKNEPVTRSFSAKAKECERDARLIRRVLNRHFD